MLGDVAPLLDLETLVVGAVDDERRDVHRGQDVADVDLGVHLRQGERRAGARAHAEVGGPPLSEARVVGHGGRALFESDGAAPVAPYLLEEVLALFGRRRPGVVGVADALGVGAHHDERERLLGIGRREEAAHRAALGDAAERGALGADGVHDGAHVVHPLFERRQTVDGHAVGETRAALVEEDEAREGGEAAQEAREARLAPEVLEVRDPAHDEDEVERPVADDLIGDVDLAAARVHRLGRPPSVLGVERGRRLAPEVKQRQFEPGGRRGAGHLDIHARRGAVGGFADLGDEAIAAPGDGLDVLLPAALLAQSLPQRGDVLRQVVLLDEAVGPDLPHQLLLAEHVAAVLHQREQGVESLRRQRHGTPLAEQDALIGVQPEDPEGVQTSGLLSRHSFQKEHGLQERAPPQDRQRIFRARRPFYDQRARMRTAGGARRRSTLDLSGRTAF